MIILTSLFKTRSYVLLGMLICINGCKKEDNTANSSGQGLPCPDIPTIVYGGQTYHTVLIGEQCWMKENLNIGSMIHGEINQSDNDTIEKYCYNNLEANCDKFGGLYQWDEMMNYDQEGKTQGICPEGWHIADDEDWKLLEGTVDSQLEVGNGEWNAIGFRGTDAGARLKSSSGWYQDGNGLDIYGFSVLPAGYRYMYGHYDYAGRDALFWSPDIGSSSLYKLFRDLNYHTQDIYRSRTDIIHGLSVRCIKTDYD